MSMQEGFLFDELSEFKKNLMNDIKTLFPNETKKFIKGEAQKVLKVAKRIAKRDVGTSKDDKKNWVEAKSYHKRFKVGKPYKYAIDDLCVRAYNSAPHAHLIEYGHVQTTHKPDKKPVGFVQGQLIFKQAEIEFTSQFLTDAEMFLMEYVDKTTETKR